jgi:SulP family sulfate permease
MGRALLEKFHGIPNYRLESYSALYHQSIHLNSRYAAVLAVLGSIDSLLTSVIADMTKTRHNSNRELIGQGIGNALLLLGIPGAGAERYRSQY